MCANKLPRPCTTVRHSCAEPRGCGCSARHTLDDTTTTGIKTALYSTLESLPRMQRLYACETMSIGGPPGGTRAWAGTCTLTSARHWLWSGVGHPSEDTDHTYSRHSHSVSSVVYRSALSDERAAQNSLYGHLGGKTTFEGSSREQCRFGTHTTSSASSHVVSAMFGLVCLLLPLLVSLPSAAGLKDCIFLHGSGVDTPGPVTETYPDYWGNIHEVTSCLQL